MDLSAPSHGPVAQGGWASLPNKKKSTINVCPGLKLTSSNQIRTIKNTKMIRLQVGNKNQMEKEKCILYV